MSLTNIKLKSNEGFTIVELLIVVVVIAILAAITIVSYNGITNKANASAAASTAATLQKKAELYASDDDGGGKYPTTLSALTNATKTGKAYYITAGTVNVTGAADPTATNGKTSVRMKVCDSGDGLQIIYFTFPGTATVNVGKTSGTCTDATS